MPISSNAGYLMMVKQTAKGTATAPTIAIPFLDESPNINIDSEIMRNSEDTALDLVMIKRTDSVGFSCYARPNITAYLLAYLFGADTKSGVSDPYTHIITKLDQGRAWLTLERCLHTSMQQRLYDYKISKVSVSGQSGKPIKLTIEGESLNTVLRTTVLTPAYESGKPFYFYDGSGRFSYAGSVIDTINSFDITMSIDSLGGLQNSEYGLLDLPDFSFDTSVELGFINDSFTNWKNIAYGGGTSKSETVYTAALDFDFQYTDGVAARQFKIAIPSIMYRSISGNKMTAAGGTHSENIAGIAKKLATTDLITCTVKNNLSADLI